MKKCYTLILLCLLSLMAFSQTSRYWVGPSSGAGGNWNNINNWSASSGGASGASVPNAGTFDVIFDQNALVNVDITSLTLNSIRVTNSRTATLFTTANTTITVNSSTVGAEGLKIDAGSVLRDSVDANVSFLVQTAASARIIVDGDWHLGGNPVLAATPGSTFSTNAVGRMDVNGRVFLRYKSTNAGGSASTLFWNAGSFLYVEKDGGAVPSSTWAATATARITGNTANATTFNGTPQVLGNVEFDCPGASVPILSLALNNNANIQGNLKIQNTNSRRLLLAFAPVATVNITVQGNLEISGVNTYAVIADGFNNYNLQLNGNFIQSAGTFSLQDNNTPTGITKLLLRGNFTQTGGTFTTNSTLTSTTTNSFIVEMNGSSAQTISASSGTIDNMQAQVALRINNPAGVTLNSPLAVGRMDFASGNINTTAANLLTINNTDNAPFVINGASNSSFVSGPVKRKTALAALYVFPVGKAGTYRYAEILPSTTAASEYTVEYFNSSFGDLSFITPLTGVSNVEYWSAQRVSGAGAQIRLSLNGTAVPGAVAADAVVVGRYNGADWVSEKGVNGSKIVPGNSTTGVALSQTLAAFNNFFTFAYGPSSSLPIILKSFSAEKGQGYNVIHWAADCFSTQAIFEIERSFDGKTFTKIETIVADQVRCQQPFDLQDKTAGQATVYYRVKVIDVDGAAYYSRIAALIYKNKGFDIVGIYPTVITTGQLKVNVTAASNAKVEFYISNSLGQIMKKIQANVGAGDNVVELNLNQLNAGMYMLTGYNSEGEAKTFRFVKQ